MNDLNQKIGNISKQKMTFLVIGVCLAVMLPFLAFSSHKAKLYVDASASGTQDGSVSHPYKTINQAMSKADKKTQIHVAKGWYKENVKIKEGVEVYGSNKNKVVIEAKDSGDPAVIMNNDTKINKITVRKGKYGIKIESHAKASVIECTVRDAKTGGIIIEGDGVKTSRMVYISDSEIVSNNGFGISSGRRKLSITGNQIRDNEGDGVDINKGSSAWISGNHIVNNDKSGMKLSIDGSNIWTKNNSIRNNGREGMEVSFSGQAGRIDIAKSNILYNHRYGVAKVQRASFANNVSLWNKYLTFDGKNQISGNTSGDVSGIIIIK